MARSEFLGAQQRHKQVDEQASGDDAAEDEVEHPPLLLPLAEEDVSDQRGEAR
jgi:hypothetical protein